MMPAFSGTPVQDAEKGPSAEVRRPVGAHALNVERLRLACGRRAPPRIWICLSILRALDRPDGDHRRRPAPVQSGAGVLRRPRDCGIVPSREETVKLALFQRRRATSCRACSPSAGSSTSPTRCRAGTRRSSTMPGIIDDFDGLAPGARAPRAASGDATAARQASGCARRCRARARSSRASPTTGSTARSTPRRAQHVPEESGRGDRARRHDRAAGVHRAVDLHARGRAGPRHQGAGQDGQARGLARAPSSATPA